MKKSIKFLACVFAVSALAVACNNNPEEPVDTTPVDTIVEDTTPVDTIVEDTVVVEQPVAQKTTTKKTNKIQKRTEVKDKINSQRTTEGLKEVDVATKGSNALKDDQLKNSDSRGAVKTRSGFSNQQ